MKEMQLPDWLTADLHFGHKNILKYEDRPFSDIEAMDEALIQNWNSCVQPSQTILIVGDFALCGTQKCEAVVKRLNGYKFLLMGNHDWKHSPNRWLKMGFWDARKGSIDLGRNLIACHLPYSGDSGDEDRYEKARPPDEGKVLLHGHVHSKWKTNGRMINVGVDVWDLKPVSREVVTKLIEEAQ